MSNSIFAFFNKEGVAVTPVKAIFSYCILDLIIQTPYYEIHDEFLELRDACKEQDKDYSDSTIMGYILRTKLAKAKCFKKDMTLKAMKSQRPLHYRDNDTQELYWASAQLIAGDTHVKPYAVLCEPVASDADNIEIVDNIDCALECVAKNFTPKDKNDTPISVGGFNFTYRNFFGANEMYLYRSTAIEDENVLASKLLYRAQDADEEFSEWRQRCLHAVMREEILKRSDIPKYGFTTLTAEDGEEVSVPTLPLTIWALDRVSECEKAKELYKPVSSIGMKTRNDDPYHTDWAIGAGLSLEYREVRKFEDAAYKWGFQRQVECLDVEHHILSRAGVVSGRVFHGTPDNAGEVESGDILILPKGSQDYHVHAIKACGEGKGGVICEQGSQVVHLVKVSREMKYGILRIEKALSMYPHGTYIQMDTNKGTVRFLSDAEIVKLQGLKLV